MTALRLAILALAALAAAPLVALPPTDAFGDPLPEGAKARVGTARFYRAGGGAEWEGATLTPDGKFLLVAVAGGAIEKIDVTTGRVAGTIGDKVATRTGRDRLRLSADGKRLLTLGDSLVAVRDAETGKLLSSATTRTDFGRAGAAGSAALSADGSTFAFGANDEPKPDQKQSAVVWTVGEGKRRLAVEVEEDVFVSVALSPDGKRLATWGRNSKRGAPMTVPDTPVQFWDATTGKKLGRFVVKEAGVTSVAFTPDGKFAAISDGKGVALVDPATGREERRLAAVEGVGGGVAFAPDGKTLAVGWTDGSLRLWDVATDKERSATKPPLRDTGVRRVVFTGNATAVTWAIEGSKVVVWEVPSGKVLSPRGGPTDTVGNVAFSPDGKHLMAFATGWDVPRWDAATGKAVAPLVLEEPANVTLPGYRAARPLPGGAKVLAHAGVVQYVYDARTGKRLHDLTNGGKVTPPLLCTDGELTLTILGIEPGQRADPSKPCTFAVADLAGKKLCEIELPGPTLQFATRTADGKGLFTTVYVPLPNECRVFYAFTLYDLATGKKLGQIELKEGPFLAPTPAGGTRVFVIHRTGEPREYDLATGKLVREINVKGLTVSAGPVLSPDGKFIAVGLTDYENLGTTDVFDVCVLDAATGKALKTFRGHRGQVTALAFAPDGKTLASGSTDTTVLLWDVSAVK